MTTPSTFTGNLFWLAPVALLLAASANLYAQQPISISLKGHSETPPRPAD
ncbi:MAG: hypothetical protein M0Q22_06305 [Sulfuritalea sp.]|jgi:hypothetical protein|nr:hypothetical protein [Sulfuritalea sp.]